MSSTLADRKYESESRCRTARGVAEVTSVEPGQAPLHHEAFQVNCASAACPLRPGWK